MGRARSERNVTGFAMMLEMANVDLRAQDRLDPVRLPIASRF
jgi:hypothetical protein